MDANNSLHYAINVETVFDFRKGIVFLFSNHWGFYIQKYKIVANHNSLCNHFDFSCLEKIQQVKKVGGGIFPHMLVFSILLWTSVLQIGKQFEEYQINSIILKITLLNPSKICAVSSILAFDLFWKVLAKRTNIVEMLTSILSGMMSSLSNGVWRRKIAVLCVWWSMQLRERLNAVIVFVMRAFSGLFPYKVIIGWNVLCVLFYLREILCDQLNFYIPGRRCKLVTFWRWTW